MRAKVCYTLYRNCTTNASLSLPIAALFRDDLALRAAIGAARSRIDRMIAAASRASCARPYGTPWTRLLRLLATATPCTACPLLPKHTLRATMKIPLLRPRLHQIRHATLGVAQESVKRSRGGSFPFEAVIARNTIPNIEAGLRSPIFHDASRWLRVQTRNQPYSALSWPLRMKLHGSPRRISTRRDTPDEDRLLGKRA